jgi:hypothetical protein
LLETINMKKSRPEEAAFCCVMQGSIACRELFHAGLVGNGEFLAAFGAACGKYLAAVGRTHSETEAVLVNPLSA